MAKFINVGHVAKNKKDPSKSHVKLTQTIEASAENPVYLQLFKPKKSDKHTEEEFQEKVMSWKRFDVVLIQEGE